MTALIAIETITAAKLFVPGGWEEIVSKLEADVRALPKEDVNTETGRKAIGALARKIASSKTGLDSLGKEHVAVLKKQTRSIDDDRAKIWHRLETLQAEVRQPLTDWENAEKARVERLETALEAIRASGVISIGLDSTAIRQRLEEVGILAQRDWQEYEGRATQAIEGANTSLRDALTATVQRAPRPRSASARTARNRSPARPPRRRRARPRRR
jgi:hypothetical protein